MVRGTDRLGGPGSLLGWGGGSQAGRRWSQQPHIQLLLRVLRRRPAAAMLLAVHCSLSVAELGFAIGAAAAHSLVCILIELQD